MPKRWRFLGFDAETYWSVDYTLRKMSTVAYVRSPEFKAHGAAIKVGSKPARWLSGTYLQTFLDGINPDETIVYGHNLQFDGDILSHHYGFVPGRYVDTLAMSRALIGNRLRNRGLDHVAAWLGIEGKLDGGRALNDTKGVRDLTPEQERSLGQYAVQDIETTYQIMQALTPLFPPGELPVQDWVARMTTQPLIVLDEAVLQKVYDDELARKEKILVELGQMPQLQEARGAHEAKCGRALSAEEASEFIKTKLRSNDQLAELLRAVGCEPPMKYSKTAKDEDGNPKRTYAFAKTDQDFVELQDCGDPHISGIVRARLGVKSSIEETRAKSFLELAQTGFNVPVPLNYSAAHTHRLGGAAKLNWQNNPRKSPIRKGIKAPEGYVLIEADSSQIELRTSSGCSGEQGVLDALAAGRDLYSEFGERVFGCEVSKTVNPDKRQISKIALLQLGYQAGWQRFQHSVWVETSKEGKPLYLSDEEAKRLVYGYRDTFSKQKALWAECQEQLRLMANGWPPNNLFTNPPLTWTTDAIILPSGLALQYPELAEVENEEDGKREFRYGDEGIKVYGGMVVENLSQALAREIIVYQTKQILKRYFVSMQIHDSVLVIVPKGEVNECADFIHSTMCTSVPFWPEIPLACEVKAGTVYGDMKRIR